MHPQVVDPAGTDDGGAALEEALRAARRGDEAGFRVLWRELQPRLLRYLRVRAGDGADDLAAETWLHVVRDLDRFDGDADGFRGWLFTVARNRSVDAARARQSRPPLVLVPDVRRLDERPDVSAETTALERMSTRHALELVASLPDDQAELVALRVIAGLDVAAVADIVGKSPGAVRVAVHRALHVLAKHPSVAPEEVS